MSVSRRERNKYLNNIKTLLVCPAKQKKAFLKAFSDNIDDYLEAHTSASFSDLQNALGTPKEIADAFLENESASNIKKKISIVKAILIPLLIVAIGFLIFLGFILMEMWKNGSGTGTITTYVDGQVVEVESIEE